MVKHNENSPRVLRYLTDLRDIDRVFGNIRLNKEYSACVQREYNRALAVEANMHSVLMEMKSPRITHAGENSEDYRNLEMARELLHQEGISLGTLSVLGGMVAPKTDEGTPAKKAFRDGEVLFGSFGGVAPHKVPHQIDDLVFYLENDSTTHPVIKAIDAHREMVRIPPYVDGNGRSARLLQNFILERAGYSPVVLNADEKRDYVACLDQVLRETRGGPSTFGVINTSLLGEENFRTFITARLLESTISLKQELDKKRTYEITYSCTMSVGENIHALARSIRMIARRENRPLTVNSVGESTKNGRLVVSGDVSGKELQTVAERCFSHNKGAVVCEIKPINC